MSATTNDFYTEGLLGARASWKSGGEHPSANLKALESRINRGIGLFITIRIADEEWSKKVQQGKAEFDPSRVRAFHKEYKRWLEPCEELLSLIEKTERAVALENASMFRLCWRFANRLAAVDTESLIHSYSEAENGKAVDLTEELLSGIWEHDNSQGDTRPRGNKSPRSA
jgi:hypothetical protein